MCFTENGEIKSKREKQRIVMINDEIWIKLLQKKREEETNSAFVRKLILEYEDE